LHQIASEHVILSRKNGGTVRRIDKGRLFLDGWGSGALLVFEGRSGRLVFDVQWIRGFVDNFNTFSEFNYRGQRWRVEFGGGNALKWEIALKNAAIGIIPEEAA
jgi:hypothetical protein